jgi:hypothetical protein
MRRILVTGAGGPAGINFISSLRIAPEQMFIVGTEANQHFIHLATTDKKYVVPKATEPGYISKLNEIIRKEKILKWKWFRQTEKSWMLLSIFLLRRPLLLVRISWNLRDSGRNIAYLWPNSSK